MSLGVFFDTCALYGEVVCCLTLRLAEARVFVPYWSEDVLQELEKNLVIRIDKQKAHRRVEVMRSFFPDSLVEDYEHLVGVMECDEKDRHVLAAAYRSPADTLVTFNVKDFPDKALRTVGIEVKTPDEFMLDVTDLYPSVMARVCYQALASYKRNPQTPIDLATILTRSGLPHSASEIYPLVSTLYENLE